MYRRRSYHAPDFFAVLIFLVLIGFGMTLAVQVASMDRDQVVDTDRVEQIPSAG